MNIKPIKCPKCESSDFDVIEFICWKAYSDEESEGRIMAHKTSSNGIDDVLCSKCGFDMMKKGAKYGITDVENFVEFC